MRKFRDNFNPRRASVDKRSTIYVEVRFPLDDDDEWTKAVAYEGSEVYDQLTANGKPATVVLGNNEYRLTGSTK